jgi:hypothetical protein
LPLTWRLFGNAGVARFEDRPVTETFTRAAPTAALAVARNAVQDASSQRRQLWPLGVHRPRNPDRDRLEAQRWYDGSGRRLPEMFHRERLFSNPGSAPFDLVQMNHYALGSAESFILKCDRGQFIPE